jgi:hypothetical protein
MVPSNRTSIHCRSRMPGIPLRPRSSVHILVIVMSTDVITRVPLNTRFNRGFSRGPVYDLGLTQVKWSIVSSSAWCELAEAVEIELVTTATSGSINDECIMISVDNFKASFSNSLMVDEIRRSFNINYNSDSKLPQERDYHGTSIEVYKCHKERGQNRCYYHSPQIIEYQIILILYFKMDMDDQSYANLSKPIKSVEEKWKLLPHFLQIRGLMRQHIDSFNHFINVDMKQVVNAKSNREIRSEADPKFFLQYTDIYVGEPSLDEESYVTTKGNRHH